MLLLAVVECGNGIYRLYSTGGDHVKSLVLFFFLVLVFSNTPIDIEENIGIQFT